MNRFVLIWCIFICMSCETYFKPEVGNSDDVLVVEGLITDKPGPHFIRISLGIGFDDSVHYEDVDRYNVSIESDNGEVYYLREYYRGFYQTSDEVKGEIGKSYRVVVEAKEGEDLFQSDWELLNPSASIDTIEVRYGLEKILRYNEVAGYFEETYPGMDLMMSTNVNSFASFYRYEYDLVYMGIQLYSSADGIDYIFVARPWSSKSTNYTYVVNSLEYASMNIVKNVFGFVKEKELSRIIQLGDHDPEATVSLQRCGVLIRLRQYSLSEVCFNFWEGILNQKEASGAIFDPVVSQVRGNIYCVNNPDKKVFGCFGASAISEYCIHANMNGSFIETSPVKYFPELSGINTYGLEPDFWVK